ncbi:transposase, IS605 OrfB family [Methanocaldococcus vulcanius M7]|uniref:Transposase, IS605 OrfB family n=1 Tax=Methanocaldococcus vulcanius (strain ATCC 700851 / DSM 12094 / M7) TaxID=579137 RepID=C9RF89_METVM|nr:zinc ribbon domain-containing protein [Methanocaldococcus vulcanius]ACX72241.1 transposase, IS605 OrfB family [Methanocaldococcus vulcanius M7]
MSSKNKLPTEIVLTYKVKHNHDLKNLPYEFIKTSQRAVDVIWENIDWKEKIVKHRYKIGKKKYKYYTTTRLIPEIPKDNDFKKALRNYLLKGWEFASHYVDGAIKTAYSAIESWKSNYLNGKRKRNKPIFKRPFVRVKTTLMKYDKEKGEIRITIKPRKEYLILNIKDEWFFERVKDFDIGEVILKDNEALITFKKQLDLSDKKVVGVDSNLKSLDLYHPEKGWIRVDLSELHRIKRVYDAIIDKLKSIYKKSPKRIGKLLKKYWNRRKNRVEDFINKLTSQLSKLFPDAIFIFEDLDKFNMYDKNSDFNRDLDRTNWKKIAKKLEYKSVVFYVNPHYTSKTCPVCGSKMKSQEGQVVKCDKCGIFDRQFVGCYNIFKRGVELAKKLLGGVGVPVTGVKVDDLLSNEPRGELRPMPPNPNVEAKLPVRKTEGFPLMVYTVDLNGRYLKIYNCP